MPCVSIIYCVFCFVFFIPSIISVPLKCVSVSEDACTLQFLIKCSETFAFVLWPDTYGQGVYECLCVYYCKAASRPDHVLFTLRDGGNKTHSQPAACTAASRVGCKTDADP